jgi:anti-sigma factor RsiW
MTNCPQENETLSMVQAGRWPDGCDDAMRTHLDACSTCADIVRVGSLIAADYHASLRTAHVPASGLVWWRMQRRTRQEAIRTASRVITVVQAIAVAAGVAVAIGILVATSRAFSFGAADLSKAVLAQWSIPLIIGLVSWLALAPVAVYLAVSKD